ncbi:MAG: FecR domain-containing protein [Bacteroidota bacterium]
MDEDFYIALLYKRLDQRIEPEEQSQLEDWLQRSEDNQLMADGIEKAWQAGGRYQKPITVDLDAEFDLLEQRIEADEATKQAPRIQSRSRDNAQRFVIGWRIAASIALLVIAGWLASQWMGGSAVEWQQARTTGGKMELALEDGSKVWLNDQSLLEYPKQYADSERRVKLEGEAFFDIAKEATRPFIIETVEGTVQVLGTSFNLRSRGKGQQLEVEVHSGRVQLSPAIEGKEALLLEAGQTGLYDPQSGQLERITDLSPNAASWHSRRLIFIDAPLSAVLEDISQHFGQDIQLANPDMANCTMINTFEKDASLEDVLNAIAIVFQVEHQINDTDDAIVLKGGKCR